MTATLVRIAPASNSVEFRRISEYLEGADAVAAIPQ
jgi:hypothetical protein